MQLKATRSENGRLTDFEIARQCFASDNVKMVLQNTKRFKKKNSMNCEQ